MMKYREKTVCFTGHRKIPPEKKDEITRRLKVMIIQLINSSVCYPTEKQEERHIPLNMRFRRAS